MISNHVEAVGRMDQVRTALFFSAKTAREKLRVSRGSVMVSHIISSTTDECCRVVVAEDDAKICAVLRVRFSSRQLNLSTGSDPGETLMARPESLNHENSRSRDDAFCLKQLGNAESLDNFLGFISGILGFVSSLLGI